MPRGQVHDGGSGNRSSRSSSGRDEVQLVIVRVLVQLREGDSGGDKIISNIVESNRSEWLLAVLENTVKSDRTAHHVLGTAMFQKPDGLSGAHQFGLNHWIAR